ncbi:MAG: hypothetical protein KKD44_29425 [Proteobacteria bacterium]|nr:hypothetical protein [Pseudomonadota bacterium]
MNKNSLPGLPKSFQQVAMLPFNLPVVIGKSLFEGGNAFDQAFSSIQNEVQGVLGKGPSFPAGMPSLPMGVPKLPMGMPKLPMMKGGELYGPEQIISDGAKIRTSIF